MNDTRLVTHDNFLPMPEAYREEVLATEFKDLTGPDGALYRHVQPRPVEEFAEYLGRVVGRPVKQLLTMVRANYAGEDPHNPIHSDEICSEYAAVLYLNTPDQCAGGTAFWKHKNLGWESVPSVEQIRAKGRSPKRETEKFLSDYKFLESWEQTGLVEMRFNRLVVYPSKRFHSRWPLTAFGTDAETARLIWVSFFDV